MVKEIPHRPEPPLYYLRWGWEYLLFGGYEISPVPLFFILISLPFSTLFWPINQALNMLFPAIAFSFLGGISFFLILDSFPTELDKPLNRYLTLLGVILIFSEIMVLSGINPVVIGAYSPGFFLSMLLYFRLWPLSKITGFSRIPNPFRADLAAYFAWRFLADWRVEEIPLEQGFSRGYLYYLARLALFTTIPSAFILGILGQTEVHHLLVKIYPNLLVFQAFIPVFLFIYAVAFIQNLVADWFRIPSFMVRLCFGLLLIKLLFFMGFRGLWGRVDYIVEFFSCVSIFIGSVFFQQVQDFLAVQPTYPHGPRELNHSEWREYDHSLNLAMGPRELESTDYGKEASSDEGTPLVPKNRVKAWGEYGLSTLFFAALYFGPFFLFSNFLYLIIPFMESGSNIPPLSTWWTLQLIVFLSGWMNNIFNDFSETDRMWVKVLAGILLVLFGWRFLIFPMSPFKVSYQLQYIATFNAVWSNIALHFLGSDSYYHKLNYHIGEPRPPEREPTGEGV